MNVFTYLLSTFGVFGTLMIGVCAVLFIGMIANACIGMREETDGLLSEVDVNDYEQGR